MNTVEKIYVLVDNETNRFIMTGTNVNGEHDLVYSLSYEYLEEYYEGSILSGKYRIEEISPLPF